MTKPDPALETIRKVRREISREFGDDPVRLIEHYMELQRNMQGSRLVPGPDRSSRRYATTSDRNAAELGR
jgi:hypothetical protein